jgi:hypothetical protein
MPPRSAAGAREAAAAAPDPPAAAPRPFSQLLGPLLLVAVVAILAYANGLPGEFVFDDKLIQRDPRIIGTESFWRIFVTDYWYVYPGGSLDLYRPLTTASYALNVMLTGLSSPAFHGINLLLHAAVCILVVLLVDALLRDRLLAVISGLLFATHPVHTEAVTGIVGRAEILAALFLLIGLYLHARRYELRGRGPATWLPVAGIAYLCALLSKETAIAGVGLLLLVDGVDRAREAWAVAASREAHPSARALAQTITAVAMVLGIALAVLVVRYLVLGTFLQRPPPKDYYLLFGHPLTSRLLTGFKIVPIYLRLLFFPYTLSADYSYRQVVLSHTLDGPGPLIGLAAAVGLGLAFLWALRARVPALVFALGFFALSYSLVSNLVVPIGVLVAERLMYLPSIGFCVAIAWAGLALSRRYLWTASSGWIQRLPAAALVLLLLLYGGRTFVRNLDWRNPETLFAATVRASPECHAARFNYAAILMRLYPTQPDKQALALEQLEKAYEIRPDHYAALVNMTVAYRGLGQLERARETALQGLRVRPNDPRMRGLLKTIEALIRQRDRG